MPTNMDVVMATINLGPEFDFFGTDTRLAVTVVSSLIGVDYLERRDGRSSLKISPPSLAGPGRQVEVPVGDQPGWIDQTGAPVSAWSYLVDVVVTAPGRTPLFWTGTATPTTAQPSVVLVPSAGILTGRVSTSDATVVNPSTGGLTLSGGGSSATPDPDVAGAYIIN